jgi:peptide deformylase
MSKKYQLKIYPDTVLREQALPVENLTGEINELLEDMASLMYEGGAIGLAAPQVGISQRIIMGDIGEGLLSLINPQIIQQSGQDLLEEGCLSLPGIQVEIERHQNILVRGIDSKGKDCELELSGLMARVVQHEIDHLNGILIIDYTSVVERFLLTQKLERMNKFQKQF